MCNKSHMCQNGQVFSFVRINFGLIWIQSVNLYKKETNPLVSSVPFSQYSLSFAWAAVMWKQVPKAYWKQPFITFIFLHLYPQFKIWEQNQKFQEAASERNTG